MSDDPRKAVHESFNGLLDEGGIVTHWTVVMEVVNSDGQRYLQMVSGGGIDGGDMPTLWGQIGMQEVALATLQDQAGESFEADDFEEPE